jgi:hypothetical protein
MNKSATPCIQPRPDGELGAGMPKYSSCRTVVWMVRLFRDTPAAKSISYRYRLTGVGLALPGTRVVPGCLNQVGKARLWHLRSEFRDLVVLEYFLRTCRTDADYLCRHVQGIDFDLSGETDSRGQVVGVVPVGVNSSLICPVQLTTWGISFEP